MFKMIEKTLSDGSRVGDVYAAVDGEKMDLCITPASIEEADGIADVLNKVIGRFDKCGSYTEHAEVYNRIIEALHK